MPKIVTKTHQKGLIDFNDVPLQKDVVTPIEDPNAPSAPTEQLPTKGEVKDIQYTGKRVFGTASMTGSTLEQAETNIKQSMTDEATRESHFRVDGLMALIDARLEEARKAVEAGPGVLEKMTGKQRMLYRDRFFPFRLPAGETYPEGFRTPELTAEQQMAWEFRQFKNMGLSEEDKELAYQKVSDRYVEKKIDQFTQMSQQTADFRALLEEEKRQRGAFGAKTYQRWVRGAGMLSGGAYHLIDDLTLIAGLDVRSPKATARMYHEALQRPELQPAIDNWFDHYIGGAVESGPFMVVAMAPAALTGGATLPSFIGAYLTTYAVEGNSAYQAALDRKEPEWQARARGTIVGMVNGGIEIVGGGPVKYYQNRVIANAMTRLQKVGRFSSHAIKNALREGLAEEVPQEIVMMIMGGDVPRKADGSVDQDVVVDRLWDAAAIGTIVGGTVDVSVSSIKSASRGIESAAYKLKEAKPLTEKQAQEKELDDYIEKLGDAVEEGSLLKMQEAAKDISSLSDIRSKESVAQFNREVQTAVEISMMGLKELTWQKLLSSAKEEGIKTFGKKRTVIEQELAERQGVSGEPLAKRLLMMPWRELQSEARGRGIAAFQSREQLVQEILIKEGVEEIPLEERLGQLGWKELQLYARKLGINTFQKRGKVIEEVLEREVSKEQVVPPTEIGVPIPATPEEVGAEGNLAGLMIEVDKAYSARDKAKLEALYEQMLALPDDTPGKEEALMNLGTLTWEMKLVDALAKMEELHKEGKIEELKTYFNEVWEEDEDYILTGRMEKIFPVETLKELGWDDIFGEGWEGEAGQPAITEPKPPTKPTTEGITETTFGELLEDLPEKLSPEELEMEIREAQKRVDYLEEATKEDPSEEKWVTRLSKARKWLDRLQTQKPAEELLPTVPKTRAELEQDAAYWQQRVQDLWVEQELEGSEELSQELADSLAQLHEAEDAINELIAFEFLDVAARPIEPPRTQSEADTLIRQMTTELKIAEAILKEHPGDVETSEDIESLNAAIGAVLRIRDRLPVDRVVGDKTVEGLLGDIEGEETAEMVAGFMAKAFEGPNYKLDVELNEIISDIVDEVEGAPESLSPELDERMRALWGDKATNRILEQIIGPVEELGVLNEDILQGIVDDVLMQEKPAKPLTEKQLVRKEKSWVNSVLYGPVIDDQLLSYKKAHPKEYEVKKKDPKFIAELYQNYMQELQDNIAEAEDEDERKSLTQRISNADQVWARWQAIQALRRESEGGPPTYKGPGGRPGFLGLPSFRRKKPTPTTLVEPPPPPGKGPYRAPSQSELNEANDALLAKLAEVKKVRKDEEIPAIKRMRTKQIARSLGIQEAAAAEGVPAADVIRRSKGGYKVSADIPQYTPIKLTDKQWDAYSRQVYNVYVGPEYKFQQTAAQDALDELHDGRLITDAEAALLIPVMGVEVAEELASSMEKLGARESRFLNLTRDLVLFWKMPFNFDVQFTRNAVNFVGRHPVKYTKGTYEALRSFASKDYTNTLIQATRGDPAYAEAEAYGMPFLQMGQLAPLGKVPEQFRGRLPYRLSKIGKKRGKAFRKATTGIRMIGKWQLAAERSFVASANWFMLDLWKGRQKQWNSSYALLESEGLSIDERARILEKVDKEKRNYTDVVGNYMKIIQAKSSTGKAIQTAANFVLWSPSMTWSRFRRPEMMLLKSGSRAYAMSIEATSVAKIYGLAMLLTTVANYFRDDDDQIKVEMNPTSSNWGRFKHGDTWFDLGGGEIQHYRALSQFVVGAIKTQSGRTVEIPREEIAKNYVEGRETALIGIFHELLTGESLFGQKVWAAPDLEQLEKEGTVTADIYAEAWRRLGAVHGGQGAFITGRWLTEHLMPASLQAFAEASITDGWPQAMAAGLTEAMAMSAQSYKTRASAELSIMQDELAQAYHGKKWDALSQDQQNTIRKNEPPLHDVQISIRKEQKRWATPDHDRREEEEIEKQIFDSLSSPIKAELESFGLTAGTVGRRFGPTDAPFYLNEERHVEYVTSTKVEVQKALDQLIGSSRYKKKEKKEQELDIQAAISEAKLKARDELTKRINAGEI